MQRDGIVIQSFRDLIVYKKAYQCALDLHRITMGFPKFEQFELGMTAHTVRLAKCWSQ